VAAQYWEVEFRNGDGVENEIYLGRLMLGPVWSPEVGPALNYKIQWQEYSVSDRSLSGIDYVDQIPPRLEIDLTLERLQGTEVFGEFARMAKKVGTKLPIIMQLTDEDLRQKKLTTVYGKFTASPGVEKTETAYKSNLIILEDL
jgi:hypothetical protein